MIAFLRSASILTVLTAASCAAARLEPRLEQGRLEPPLSELIPQRFGAWEAEAEPVAQVLLVPTAADAPAAQAASYDDVLMRTYRRSDGARVMVALAYGRRQTQELKIHRPELCYYAQGFEVRSLGSRPVRLDDARGIETMALLAENRPRTEVVTYWIRIGERLANGPWDMRWTIFRDGLSGRVPDGLLFRASSLATSPATVEREIELQHEILAELYRELSPSVRRLLTGGESAP